MKALILDFEADNAIPETAIPVETGWIVFDLKTWKIEQTFQAYHKVEVEFDPRAIIVCGITNEILKKKGIPVKDIAKPLYKALKEVDIIITHNGLHYDLHLLDRMFAEFGRETPPIIKFDSMIHVIYPERITIRKLLYLCAEHDFLPKDILPKELKGQKAHGALVDCYLLWHLLSFYKDRMPEFIERAKCKIYKIRAEVTMQTNQLAKDRKFHAEYIDGKFNGWFKDILVCDLQQELDEIAGTFKLAALVKDKVRIIKRVDNNKLILEKE